MHAQQLLSVKKGIKERQCMHEDGFVKILATADYHGDSRAFLRTAAKARQAKTDAIIVCGDVTHFGTEQQARDLLSLMSDTEQPVFFVPGNCDPPSLTENVGNIECIHGKCRQINEMNLLGVGGSSPTPMGTPFELDEKAIRALLERSLRKCRTKQPVLLVSHSPPRNTAIDRTFSGEHVGSTSIREFAEKAKPSLVLCGHIHEARGIDKIDETVVVNPGPARHGFCTLIDIEDGLTTKLGRL